MGSEAKKEKWEMKNGKGKGLHDNGKKSNVQILSWTTPFPVRMMCSHSYKREVHLCAYIYIIQ